MKSLAVVRWSAIGIAVVIALGALCRVDKVVEVKPPEKIVGMENPTGVKIEPGGIPISVKLGGGWGATALLGIVAAWRAWKWRRTVDYGLMQLERASHVIAGATDTPSKIYRESLRVCAIDAGVEAYVNARVRALGLARGSKR